jgi:hypothetical protein
MESDFELYDFLKQLSASNKTFSYESNPENLFYWKKLEVESVLVAFDKVGEFRRNAL